MEAYRAGVKEVSNILRSAKSSNFDLFLSTLSPSSSPTYNFNFIKRYKNRFYNPCPDSMKCNRALFNPELFMTFNRISQYVQGYEDYQYEEFPTIDTSSRVDHFLSQEIRVSEIVSAVKKAKVRSAPGPDRLPYLLWKNLPHSYMVWLTQFFNRLIQDCHYFPNDWKDFNICFISKGKI